MAGHPFHRPRRYLIALVCLFVVTAGVSAAPQSVNVEDITLTGDSVVETETENDITYVAGWKSYTANASVTGDAGEYQACLVIGSPANKREITCEEIEVTSDETETITFEQEQWPANMSGRQTVSVVLRQNNSTTTTDESHRTSHQVNIYTENGDADSDGLSNQAELKTGTKINKGDTDGDELSDGKEVNVVKSKPRQNDSDNDTLSDGIERKKHDTNPIKKDSDNDSISDPKEINRHDTNPIKPDTDDDGLKDKFELKESNTNPKSEDTDGDGLLDREEANVLKTNPRKTDSDKDDLNDYVEAKEIETNLTDWDTDDDGLGDGIEENEYGTNPKSGDTDGDGVSDATEINRGTDPNGKVEIIFGYTIEDPRQVGSGVAIVCLVAIGGAGYWWRRRRKPTPEQAIDDSTKAKPELTEKQEAENAAVSEPLTDEDRILQLLDESDGRLRQSRIVSETGWSKSKVSRLLSRMADDGQIIKITVGRENLITRPGDEPKHAGSAFED